MNPAGTRLVVSPRALIHNLKVLAAHAPGAQQIAIVKADAYGHGLTVAADAAARTGVTWFGVAQLPEALTLAAHMPPAPPVRVSDPASPGGTTSGPRIVTWLAEPTSDFAAGVRAGLDLSASTPWALNAVLAAARATGVRARLQLQLETGMHRSGFAPAKLPAVLEQLTAAATAGEVEVTGVWSHCAQADDPRPAAVAATRAQITAFAEGAALVRARFPGVIRHLAASAGILHYPEAWFDAVRPGIAMYGLDPDPAWPTLAQACGVPAAQIAARTAVIKQLRPALRLEAPLVEVKALAAGAAVSYGGTWRAPTDRWVGLVPLGYGDGIPRHASNQVTVWIAGQSYRQVGRVCMDQFVVDLGPRAEETPPVPCGECVVLWGEPPAPTADEWAQACGTIGYEIVTRVGTRIPRYTEETA